MSVEYQRRCFNVDEYYRMLDVGVLTRDDRVELIDGEIIEMNPIGSRHAACVTRVGELLTGLFMKAVIVRIQNPVRLNEYSEPEPDIALLKRKADFYAEGHPSPSDVLLIIEVADSSLDYDKKIKLPLYARAGIPEVWIEDLVWDRIETYSQPANGTYQNIRIAERGDSISPEMLPSVVLSVEEILG